MSVYGISKFIDKKTNKSYLINNYEFYPEFSQGSKDYFGKYDDLINVKSNVFGYKSDELIDIESILESKIIPLAIKNFLKKNKEFDKDDLSIKQIKKFIELQVKIEGPMITKYYQSQGKTSAIIYSSNLIIGKLEDQLLMIKNYMSKSFDEPIHISKISDNLIYERIAKTRLPLN